MKRIIIMGLSVGLLLTSCYDDSALQQRVAALEAYNISSLKTSLSSVEDKMKSVESSISGLEKKQSSLSSQLSEDEKDIDALQKKINSLQAELDGLKTQVGADETSIKNLQNSIEDLKTKIEVLSTLNSEISTLKGQYSTLKSELSSLQTTVSNLSNNVYSKTETDAKIKDAVDAISVLNGNLQSLSDKVDAMEEKITAIEVRLSSAEENIAKLLAQVQSVTVVPQFNDGGVAVFSVGETEIDFEIFPHSVAEQLSKSPECFSLRKVSTEIVKSSSSSLIDIERVLYKDGILTIVIKGSILSPDFFDGTKGNAMRLLISDGASTIASSYFPLHASLGGIENLSAEGHANSYIVSAAGMYSIDLVKGNSNELLDGVDSAEVIWESYGTDEKPEVGCLVYDILIYRNRVRFSTSEKKGNALIAAKDKNGSILWSWHIWLTDRPVDQEYYNNAGIVMDRNLGATSAIPGDVCALGLLYQWGRKDPFLGSCSISSSIHAESTLEWPSEVKSSALLGTIDYTIANPTVYLLSNQYNEDWYYTGNRTTDKTRWQPLDKDKGMYDPCPYGYRVIDLDVWDTAGDDDYRGFNVNFDSKNRGVDFGDNKTSFGQGIIWYPAAGYYLGYVGNFGFYWTCRTYEYESARMYFYYGGDVQHHATAGHAASASVRCLKEKH